MSSGIALDDTCTKRYTDFKMNKMNQYITFRIADDYKKIIVDEETGSYSGPYQEFEDYLKTIEKEAETPVKGPSAGCRYAAVFYHYRTSEGNPRTKIMFVTYTSDNAKTKDKLVYTASKQPLRNALEGIDVDIQANDLQDAAEEEIKEKIQRKFNT